MTRHAAGSWSFGKAVKSVLCTLFVLTLCSFSAVHVAAAENAKTIVVLVDLSDSTEAARQTYLEDFRRILDTMSGSDVLLVSRITKSASAVDSLPIQVALKEAGIGDNPRKAQHDNWIAQTRALVKFEELIKPTENATPIADVLEKLPRWFANFPNPRKVVVLFSDMRESSPSTANFESKTGWAPAAMDAFLARLKKDRLIPDLTGVRIYVAGALDKDDKRLRAVRAFWQRYFEVAKADFAIHRYDTKLVKFDECQGRDGCPGKFFTDHREGEVRKALEQRK